MDLATWSQYLDTVRPPVGVPSRRLSIDAISILSRTPSRTSSKTEGRRKSSFAAMLKPTRTLSVDSGHVTTSKQLPPKIQALLLRIPDIIDRDTGRPMKDLAREDLERIPSKHVVKVMEEYTRIPRNIRLLTMLTIKPERRTVIKERVREAKAALIAKLEQECEAADKEDARLSNLKKSPPPSKDKHVNRYRADSKSSVIIADTPLAACYRSKSSPALRHSGDIGSISSAIVPVGHNSYAAATPDISTMPDLFGGWQFHSHKKSDAGHPLNPKTAETLPHVAKDVAASPAQPKIAMTIRRVITPTKPSTAAKDEGRSKEQTKEIIPGGNKEPSRNNPFASFITERSDTAAEKLPTELKLCYFAHNKVQDQLRALWRQQKGQATAEQVARELWEQLPVKEFQASIPFEGKHWVERPLEADQLEYMWVLRFWERCKIAKW